MESVGCMAEILLFRFPLKKANENQSDAENGERNINNIRDRINKAVNPRQSNINRNSYTDEAAFLFHSGSAPLGRSGLLFSGMIHALLSFLSNRYREKETLFSGFSVFYI